MALDQHRHHYVTPSQFERLSRTARRKPRIALMGEFSAGKSTILNVMIGQPLLPTKVTATELPPVWICHGKPKALWVDHRGESHELPFGDFASVPATADHLRIFAEAEILQHVDIIDTPGISDPNLAEESWRFAAARADMVLWCSAVTQAWRETERGTWVSLPRRLRSNSLLVVTHADKIGNLTDRERVERRLRRETAGLFNDMIFISGRDAQRALESSDGNDSSLWIGSNGATLMAKVSDRSNAIAATRLAALSRFQLSEGYDIGAGPDRVGSGPQQGAPADVSIDTDLAALPGRSSSLVLADDARPQVALVRPVRPVRPTSIRHTERPSATDAFDMFSKLRSELMKTELTDDVGDENDLTITFNRGISRQIEDPDAESGSAGTPTDDVSRDWPGTQDDRTEPVQFRSLRLRDDIDIFAPNRVEDAAENDERTPELDLPGDVVAEDVSPTFEPELFRLPAFVMHKRISQSAPDLAAVAVVAADTLALSDRDDEGPQQMQAVFRTVPEVSKEVLIWRKIVQRNEEFSSESTIVSMIEQLLNEIFNNKGLSEVVPHDSMGQSENQKATRGPGTFYTRMNPNEPVAETWSGLA